MRKCVCLFFWGGFLGVCVRGVYNEKRSPRRNSFEKDWRRPTFPQTCAVSSAMPGLTSLFGMGRGEHRLYNHQNVGFNTLAEAYRSHNLAGARPLGAGPDGKSSGN